MRKWMLLLALPLCLCGCERGTLMDPVLFCEAYNRVAAQPIVESDAYLRAENEVMLFSEETVVRLKMNVDGAIHTAVVTGAPTSETTDVAENAFAVLAQPFSETAPLSLIEQSKECDPSVQTAETKRFFYAVYRDADSVTFVQINRLLSSIPVLPSLRPSGSE